MTTYTTAAVEVTLGLLPTHRRTVVQNHIFKDGEYYGVAKDEAEAQAIVTHLNADEAAYQQQVKNSGLPEWQFLDQNTAG